MANRLPTGWAIRVCRHCGGGYDRFKAGGARGRYCSAECLEAARSRKRAASASRRLAASLPADQPI